MQKTGTPNEYRRKLKNDILVFTMNEFIQNGIRAVKMDNVARSLGISKRTVYEIYNDKEEILIDGLSYQFDLAEKKLAETFQACNNVIEIIANFYKIHMLESAKVNPAFYVDVEKYPKALELIQARSNERDKKAVGFFETGVKEGYFREDVDYSIVMEIAKHTSESIMTNQLFNKYPIQQLFRNIMFLCVRGLCTLKGVELFDELIKK